MPGKFELYKDKGGEFRFRLFSSDGKTLLGSEGYKVKSSATKGMESVRKNAPDDARYERKATNSGQFMFNLKSGNGQIVGTSVQYKTEAERDRAIDLTKQEAAGAALDDRAS